MRNEGGTETREVTPIMYETVAPHPEKCTDAFTRLCTYLEAHLDL